MGRIGRYIALAERYCADVLSGAIPACKYVREACQRQVDDLKRKDWAYTFDHDKAERVCRFIELLPHIKGEWAGTNIVLEPWQCFILTTVFGWVDHRGNRRFKSAYVEVPRKNAKSTLTSGVALYCLTADREEGAEVYSAATTRDQARIVFNDAKRMVERCAGLRANAGVKTSAHAVYIDRTAASFKALSRDQGGNLDGLNVHFACVDELHAHKTRDVWDVLETATGARRQPLLWAITTAGFNRSGICYEQRSYVLKILSGSVFDDEYFGVVYTIDEDDDWTSPESWRKANPNWDVSVIPEDIARKARKAMEMSTATNNFLTKHLNVWVNADTAWMDMRAWDACADAALMPDQFSREPCWAGVDLSSKIDIAAKVDLFRRDIDGISHYYAFGRYWLPEETIENSTNSQYQGWSIDGLLTATPGNIIDIDEIEREIREIASLYQVECVAYDPFQATQMAGHLVNEGVPMVEVRPTVANFSEAMKELEALVLAGRFHHNGDPILTWMVSNVVCHRDAKDNIYPRKELPENKIDGVIALLMALNRALLQPDTGSLDAYLKEPLYL